MPHKILNFPKIADPRGNLTFIQNPPHIPFDIKRVFWEKAMSGNKKNSGYASATQQEVIIAIKGSFDIVITSPDGSIEKTRLDKPNFGLLIPALTWFHLENFSDDAIALHLASAAAVASGKLNDFTSYKNVVS